MTDFEEKHNVEVFTEALNNLNAEAFRLGETQADEGSPDRREAFNNVLRLSSILGAAANLVVQSGCEGTVEEMESGFIIQPEPTNMPNHCLLQVPNQGVALSIAWTKREKETLTDAFLRVIAGLLTLEQLKEPHSPIRNDLFRVVISSLKLTPQQVTAELLAATAPEDNEG